MSCRSDYPIKKIDTNCEINGTSPLEISLSLIENVEDQKLDIEDNKLEVLKSIISAPMPPKNLGAIVHNTLENGNLLQLVALLKAGVNINIEYKEGISLLEKTLCLDEKEFGYKGFSDSKQKIIEKIVRTAIISINIPFVCFYFGVPAPEFFLL